MALLGALSILQHGRELEAKLWVAPASLLAFCCGLAVSEPQPPRCTTRGDVEVLARVQGVRHGPEEARVGLQVLKGRQPSSGWRVPEGTRIEIRIDNRLAPPRGSIVRFGGQISPRTELRNPSPHPDLRPRKPGVCWGRIGDEALVVTHVSALGRAMHAVRKRIRMHMVEHLPRNTAAVARALVLGDGGALEYEQRRTIAAVGLAHLFAVSGLHVALVSGTLVRLLSWLVRGCSVAFDARRLAAGVGIPLTLLHAVFAGGSPSAWRAALTAASTWFLVAIGRRPSATAATAAAALALSVPDPSMALRPAFLLSIVATSAILSTPRHDGRARWARLRSSSVISARTLVATAPMVWWWFGSVPLVGWLTNILVLPLGSWLVVPLAHLFALTPWIPTGLQWAGAALTMAVGLLLSLCDVFASLSWTEGLPPLDVAQGLIAVVACLLLLAVRGGWRRFGILAAASVAWLAAEHALVAREQPHDALRMTFVDVGQGDATLIDFPDGRLALVDTGQGGRHPAVRALRELLAARRRRHIDLVVITHGHPDHYGGLRALIDETSIGELWLNGQLLVEERDRAMTGLASAALARGVKIRFAPELCEAPRRFGGAMLEVLWPCPRYDPELDLNDNSITIRVTFGRRSFLLTGDLESEAENRLIQRCQIGRSDVLKVAHHGSKTSTSLRFLDLVRPSWAVISSGAGNRYGHPNPEVISRLRGIGAMVFRTDAYGGVMLRTDGERIEVAR